METMPGVAQMFVDLSHMPLLAEVSSVVKTQRRFPLLTKTACNRGVGHTQ